jgi:hypothetical protein
MRIVALSTCSIFRTGSSELVRISLDFNQSAARAFFFSKHGVASRRQFPLLCFRNTIDFVLQAFELGLLCVTNFHGIRLALRRKPGRRKL